MDIIPFPASDDNKPTSTADGDQDVVQQAAGYALPFAVPGHVFTLTWLEQAFGLSAKPADTSSFETWNARRARLIDLWRTEMLVNHRIHIEKRQGRGYLVIAPQDTPFVAVKVAVRDLSRAIKHASDKILYAPDDLTDLQKQQRRDAVAYLGMVEQAIKHARPKPPRPGTRASIAPQAE